jgi:guanylate kinase
MKFKDDNFDERVGEIRDDSVVIYKYPSKSNGFGLISHITTLYGNTDKSVVIVSDYVDTVQRELQIYSNYETTNSENDYNYPANNIKVIETDCKSIETLIKELKNSIIIFHSINSFKSDISKIDDMRDKLTENNINIWLCDPFESLDNEIPELADIYLEFEEELSRSNSIEYVYVRKNRYDKSKSHIMIRVEFNPHLMVDTEQLVD